MASYDVFGNIVVWKFPRDVKLKEKKIIARDFLDTHKSVRTFLEKVEKFSGRLRTQETKWIMGEKTKEVLYKENGCLFRFNVDTCYFSSRLASERKEIALKCKKDERVLVMFGGVAPFAIVIGKLSKAEKVVSVELGRDCNKYAKENVKRNRLDNVEIVGGDVRNVLLRGGLYTLPPALNFTEKKNKGKKGKIGGDFDRIVMARPNLKDSFLDVAFRVVRKGGVVHYYGFVEEEKKNELLEMILEEAKRAGKKIKILGDKRAGEIGVRKFRYRVDLKILN
jgi:tRNA (guanine37-N1)-methyltransferase